MADEELTRHFFRLLTVGPEAWNKWKKENPDAHLDFSGHKFEGILTAHLYMFSGKWNSGKSAQVKSRLAADFTGWETDNERFNEQVDRVATALRADAGGRERPPDSKL